MSKLLATLTLLLSFLTLALGAPKNVLIIYGKSSHQNYCHNNKEVGLLLESILKKSSYSEQLNVQSVFNYPKDLSLVENADLIIISSDGGSKHALYNKNDLTKHTKHLDSVLKKTQAGLVMIHWATDAPSAKFKTYHPENGPLMEEWIGASYFWNGAGKKNKDATLPLSSWTWKYPVLDLKVNQEHPVTNGVPESFKLQDEYYFNFFTEGEDQRNPVADNVTVIHSGMAPSKMADTSNPETFRMQPVFWTCDRADGGRSVATTAAHMYHTWANPHFFKTFANSIIWSMGMEIPEGGVDIAPPSLDELVSMSAKVQIHTKALHFK